MCRHVAYAGPGASLSDVMWDLPHSMEHQAYAPDELLSGVVCADGFGVGWYDPDTRPEPARYVSDMPIWSDPNLPSFGPLVRSPMILGAIRNATEAGSSERSNSAPFRSGTHLWSLNGYLREFGSVWHPRLVDEWISPARRAMVHGSTDAEFLFQAFLTRLDESGGGRDDAPAALQSLVRDALGVADEAGVDVQINLLVSDGKRVLATRAGNQPESNSLYHLQDGSEFPGGHIIASEPLYDDPAWEKVADRTLLVVEEGAPPIRLAL